MSSLPSVDIPSTVTSSHKSPIFTCKYCGLCYSSEKDYLNHVELLLSSNDPSKVKQKSRVCNICNKTFVTHRAMRQHFGKTHSRPNRIKCRICERKFKNSYALRYHTRQVHEKSTQVKCELCQKIFYNRYRMRGHLEVCEGMGSE